MEVCIETALFDLITLGIFLFFSIYYFDIKVFKNKEKFYKNKVNMLLISNLIYKLKDITRLLFLITILYQLL